MPKNKFLILWDLDGTILDAGLGVLPAIEEAISNRGFIAPEPNVLRQFVGPKILDSLRLFTDIPLEFHRDILREFKTVTYKKYFGNAQIYPGMQELLAELHDLGCVQGIASQKPEHLVVEVLDQYRLRDSIEIVSGAADDFDQINSHLPTDKPGILQRALKLASEDFEIKGSVMIGDRVFDGEAAMATGIPFIGVKWGYAAKGELEKFDSPMANNLQELRSLLLDKINVQSLEE